jgi:hypothetical protein
MAQLDQLVEMIFEIFILLALGYQFKITIDEGAATSE